MSPKGPSQVEYLTGQCRDIPIEREPGLDEREVDALTEVLVDDHSSAGLGRQAVDCFSARNGRGLVGVLAVRRAAYEEGDEIPYDGRPNFINKICFLGIESGRREKLPAALVAHSILGIGGDRLFIAEVESDRAARVFQELGFSRICTSADRTRYGYLLAKPPATARRREADRVLSRQDWLDRLGREEADVQRDLKRRTGFDLHRLLAEGWTTYAQHAHDFLFLAGFGQAGQPAQAALKVDLFDLSSGAHVGYVDTVAPADGDFALQDDAIADFPCVVPQGAGSLLEGRPPLQIDSADEAREGWPRREGIWVRVDYRRAGIGQTLERVAGDLCKLAFPDIRRIGVIFPADSVKAPEFHYKAAAIVVQDPLYCFEYRLSDSVRPVMAIRYGL